jgi:hypothetical protein
MSSDTQSHTPRQNLDIEKWREITTTAGAGSAPSCNQKRKYHIEDYSMKFASLPGGVPSRKERSRPLQLQCDDTLRLWLELAPREGGESGEWRRWLNWRNVCRQLCDGGGGSWNRSIAAAATAGAATTATMALFTTERSPFFLPRRSL